MLNWRSGGTSYAGKRASSCETTLVDHLKRGGKVGKVILDLTPHKMEKKIRGPKEVCS